MIDDKLHWYKDATIYELHIKAFKDGNGDGIGDFKGLMENLDYLEELGVTAIWLLPFYPSPQRDDGYDIADYYNVNPNYGTMEDFKSFVEEAHRRNLKVITELVINHTSDQNPWFQRSRRAPKDSPERNWYVWTDNPEQYKDVRIIFTDTEPSNWTYDPIAKQYYWHRFFSHQPDLNFDNLEVQQEIFNMLDFWANTGVDGFRLDAIPYLFERENTNSENLPETHDFLKKIRKHVDEKYPGLFLLAEANMWPEDSASYFGTGDECHMNFHFPIMPRMYLAVKTEQRYPIIDILEQTPSIPETCQWGMFLRNHDELTLEMVTDEERDFMYKNYAPDLRAKINVGIRHRLAPLMDNDRRKIELMNILLFSMPGTPVLYYGDEIGMGDNFYLKDRDGVRTPMQWSAGKNAGFSDATPHKLYLPVIASDEYKPDVINVDLSRRNPNSFFHWIRKTIQTRKKYKVFGRGDITFLNPENSKILAFVRSYQDEKILVIVNLSKNPQATTLNLSELNGYVPTEIFGKSKFPEITAEPYQITLSSYGYYWLALNKINAEINVENSNIPEVLLLDEFIQGKSASIFTYNILPHYLQKCRWYGGKALAIQQIEIKSAILASRSKAYILLIKVTYNEGFPETYFLPVAFAELNDAQKLEKEFPKSIISKVKLSGKEGVLYDAVYNEEFRNELYEILSGNESLKTGLSTVYSEISSSENLIVKEISSIMVGVEQSNTSIIYNNKHFLKLYRKVDSHFNPDVEVTRFLTEKTNFTHSPIYSASLFFKIEKEIYTIGLLQKLIQNDGDAWSYYGNETKIFLESIKNSSEEITEDVVGKKIIDKTILLGKRTAEMHIALSSTKEDSNFETEEFSLHYQSSLYAGLYSMVRSSFATLTKQLPNLLPLLKIEAENIQKLRPEILNSFKRLTYNKIEALKTRTHGDYHLGQVLVSENDFVIIDFEGEPARPFSERRLKKSPVKDVAGMLRSFHYSIYSSLLQGNFTQEEIKSLQPKAERWYKIISESFLQSYLNVAAGNAIIPKDQNDFKILLETFILEKAIYELNYELVYRPDWVIIPIEGIKAIMEK